jgi:hypothetical protein
MPNYDWQHFSSDSLPDRFPKWAAGRARWERYFTEALRPQEWLDQFRAVRRPRFAVPRLFISHRQADRDLALRIAWLANRAGMEFWIDVLDPQLRMINGEQPLAVATAGIIETALLNSSHLIALMTPKTRGSLWLPYEYGRVKEMLPATVQVACWRHPNLDDNDFPEYLYLGVITLSEEQIDDWLKAQLQGTSSPHSAPGRGSQPEWYGPEPDPLPEPFKSSHFAAWQ